MPSYADLARRRCATRWEGFTQPEDYGYDFREFVSPYTKTAGNLEADTFIVLQDWISHDGLVKRGYDPEIQRRGHDATIITNKRLKELLRRLFGLDLSDVYGTNAFVFVKPGGMSSSLRLSDIVRSVEGFTKHEIALVRPKRVLALGAMTAKALFRAGIEHIAVPHPALRGHSVEQIETIWRSRFDA